MVGGILSKPELQETFYEEKKSGYRLIGGLYRIIRDVCGLFAGIDQLEK